MPPNFREILVNIGFNTTGDKKSEKSIENVQDAVKDLNESLDTGVRDQEAFQDAVQSSQKTLDAFGKQLEKGNALQEESSSETWALSQALKNLDQRLLENVDSSGEMGREVEDLRGQIRALSKAIDDGGLDDEWGGMGGAADDLGDVGDEAEDASKKVDNLADTVAALDAMVRSSTPAFDAIDTSTTDIGMFLDEAYAESRIDQLSEDLADIFTHTRKMADLEGIDKSEVARALRAATGKEVDLDSMGPEDIRVGNPYLAEEIFKKALAGGMTEDALRNATEDVLGSEHDLLSDDTKEVIEDIKELGKSNHLNLIDSDYMLQDAFEALNKEDSKFDRYKIGSDDLERHLASRFLNRNRLIHELNPLWTDESSRARMHQVLDVFKSDRIEDIEGVGPTLADNFRKAGFDELEDIATAGLEELAGVDGVGEVRGRQFRFGATQLLGKQVNESTQTALSGMMRLDKDISTRAPKREEKVIGAFGATLNKLQQTGEEITPELFREEFSETVGRIADVEGDDVLKIVADDVKKSFDENIINTPTLDILSRLASEGNLISEDENGRAHLDLVSAAERINELTTDEDSFFNKKEQDLSAQFDLIREMGDLADESDEFAKVLAEASRVYSTPSAENLEDIAKARGVRGNEKAIMAQLIEDMMNGFAVGEKSLDQIDEALLEDVEGNRPAIRDFLLRSIHSPGGSMASGVNSGELDALIRAIERSVGQRGANRLEKTLSGQKKSAPFTEILQLGLIEESLDTDSDIVMDTLNRANEDLQSGDAGTRSIVASQRFQDYFVDSITSGDSPLDQSAAEDVLKHINQMFDVDDELNVIDDVLNLDNDKTSVSEIIGRLIDSDNQDVHIEELANLAEEEGDILGIEEALERSLKNAKNATLLQSSDIGGSDADLTKNLGSLNKEFKRTSQNAIKFRVESYALRSALDTLGVDVIDLRQDFGELRKTFNELRPELGLTSINLGAVNVGLRNMTSTLSILSALLGPMIAMTIGFAGALVTVGGALGAFTAVGALGFLEAMEQQMAGVNDRAEAQEKLMENLRASAMEALEPLQNAQVGGQGSISFFIDTVNRGLTLLNHFARASRDLLALDVVAESIDRIDQALFTGEAGQDSLIAVLEQATEDVLPVLTDAIVYLINAFPEFIKFTAHMATVVGDDFGGAIQGILPILATIIKFGAGFLEAIFTILSVMGDIIGFFSIFGGAMGFTAESLGNLTGAMFVAISAYTFFTGAVSRSALFIAAFGKVVLKTLPVLKTFAKTLFMVGRYALFSRAGMIAFSVGMNVATVATTALTRAFTLLKYAIAKTGIGLIVVGLGALITYLLYGEDIMAGISNIIKTAGEYFDSFVDTVMRKAKKMIPVLEDVAAIFALATNPITAPQFAARVLTDGKGLDGMVSQLFSRAPGPAPMPPGGYPGHGPRGPNMQITINGAENPRQTGRIVHRELDRAKGKKERFNGTYKGLGL